MKEKIILTDCDGVLLDWVAGFKVYLAKQGYELTPDHNEHYNISKWIKRRRKDAFKLVCDYNDSDDIKNCVALRDAVKYVGKLAEQGYKFRAITSLSLNPNAKVNRIANLKALFGDVFDEVVCLGCAAKKDEALAQYKDSGLFWIEDKPENAELGATLGLKALLVKHDHNTDHIHNDVTPVNNWKEIYRIINES